MSRYTVFIFSFLYLFCFVETSYSQIGIGNTNPDSSSILDITSTTQGMLAPRMTTLQRNAITNPAEGLLVFDIDLNTFYFYNGTIWTTFASSTEKKTGWVSLSDGNYSLTLPGITLAQSINPTNFTNINLDFTDDVTDNIIEAFAPTGYNASDFFDDSINRITPLAVGDAIELRLQFEAIPDANNSFLVIAIDIGSPNGIVIFQKTVPLLRGSGDTNKISESILLFQLGTFATNGAIIKMGYATSSGSPGNVNLSNFSLVISRVNHGD